MGMCYVSVFCTSAGLFHLNTGSLGVSEHPSGLKKKRDQMSRPLSGCPALDLSCSLCSPCFVAQTFCLSPDFITSMHPPLTLPPLPRPSSVFFVERCWRPRYKCSAVLGHPGYITPSDCLNAGLPCSPGTPGGGFLFFFLCTRKSVDAD